MTEFVFALPYYIRKVRPLEAALQKILLPEAQLLHYVIRDFQRGGRCQCYHGGIDYISYFPDLKIIRAEVVTPLGYTMCLIHNDIANLHLWKIRLEKERAEPFRRQIQKLHVAVSGIVQREVHFTPVHPGINRQRLYPAVPQILHLVFHQRDKGSDDQRDTVRHQSRHLEAHGFSASGREYRQHVLAVQRRPHDLLLHGPERGVSPVF